MTDFTLDFDQHDEYTPGGVMIPYWHWIALMQGAEVMYEGKVYGQDDGPFLIIPEDGSVEDKPSKLPQFATLRGGAGSGHHDHEGRPGEVGGSLPSGERWREATDDLGRKSIRRRYEGAVESMTNKLKERYDPLSFANVPPDTRTEIIIAPTGEVFMVDDHDLAASLILDQVLNDGTFALEGEAPNKETYYKWLHDVSAIPLKAVFGPKEVMMSMGFVRAMIDKRSDPKKNFVGFEAVSPVSRKAKQTIRDIYAIFPENIQIETNTRNKNLLPEGEFYNTPHKVEIFLRRTLAERGGEGSGHHDHAGRPGEVGGSLPSGQAKAGAPYDPLSANRFVNLWHDSDVEDDIQNRIAGFLTKVEQETGYRLEDVTFTADALEIAKFANEKWVEEKYGLGWTDNHIREVVGQALDESVMGFARNKRTGGKLIYINAISNYFPGPSSWAFDFYLIHEIGHELQRELRIEDHPFGLNPPEDYVNRVLGYSDDDKDDEYRSDLFASYFAGPDPATGENSWGSRTAADDEYGFPKVDPPIPMTDDEFETTKELVELIRDTVAEGSYVERANGMPEDEPFIIKGPPDGLLEGINQSPEGTDCQVIDDEYLDAIADQLIERGGAGSGHHGHKGRLGEVGGSLPSGVSRARLKAYDDVGDAVRSIKSGWQDGDARGVALNALQEDIGEDAIGETHVWKRGDEIVGVLSISKTVTPFAIDDLNTLDAPDLEGDRLTQPLFMASNERGMGTAMMQWAVDTAADRGHGLWIYSEPEAIGFYEKIGMRTPLFVDTGEPSLHFWYFTANEVKTLSSGFVERVLPKVDAKDEPENGVFTAYYESFNDEDREKLVGEA